MSHRPRVLLTGPRWYGDLVPFCQRALDILGVDHFTTIVNDAPSFAAAAKRLATVGRLPIVGPAIEWRVLRKRGQREAADCAARITAAAREFQPNLILSLAGWGHPLLPEGLPAVSGCQTAVWLMDDPFQRDEALARLVSTADRTYVVDASWIEPTRLFTGKPVQALPCGADLSVHRPVGRQIPSHRQSKVAFVGQSYLGHAAGLQRQRLLSSVRDLGLRIYGDRGWLKSVGVDSALPGCYQGGEIDTEEANAVYCGADVVININHPQFRVSTNLRTFAIAAAEGFQVVDWRPGVEQLFIPGEELITYRSAEELRSAVHHFLGSPDERRRIAKAGRERVVRDHTYAHRLRVILQDADLLS